MLKKKGVEELVVGADYISLIWVPDTFFVNEKVAYFHAATQDNQFLRITHLGEILRSMRLTVKGTCPMDLALFPMDSQLCTLVIESYGYTMADLVYVWNDKLKSVEVSPEVSLTEFYVVGYRQRRVLEVLTSGNYSRLCADILFSRSMGYYIIQVYIPSSLIVVMSWVSFYLDRASAPARVGLGVTTVLTMVTLMGAVNRSLPKISYMKALDIYLAFCFFMVFGALLEYATVSYTDKRIKLNKRKFEDFKKQLEEMKDLLKKKKLEEMQLVTVEEEMKKWDTNEANHGLLKDETVNDKSALLFDQVPATLFGCRASDIERYARIVFPLLFFTFHMVYWTILMSVSDITIEGLIPLKMKKDEHITNII